MSGKLNIESIAEELDFDIEDVEMLLEVFFESSSESMLELKKAIDSKNYDNIFSNAHSIKGSASNLLLKNVADLAAIIEKNASESNNVDYMYNYEELENALENIQSN